jgi:predicted ester cyclase
MSTEENKRIARRIIEEGLSKHNLQLIDEYFDPSYVENQFGLKPTIAGMKADFEFLFHAFPDYHLQIEDIIANEETVWLRMNCTGTNLGGFMGPPNGKTFSITVMDVLRFIDGKVVEHWGVPDRFAVLLQLELLPQSSKK